MPSRRRLTGRTAARSTPLPDCLMRWRPCGRGAPAGLADHRLTKGYVPPGVPERPSNVTSTSALFLISETASRAAGAAQGSRTSLRPCLPEEEAAVTLARAADEIGDRASSRARWSRRAWARAQTRCTRLRSVRRSQRRIRPPVSGTASRCRPRGTGRPRPAEHG